MKKKMVPIVISSYPTKSNDEIQKQSLKTMKKMVPIPSHPTKNNEKIQKQCF